METVWDSHPPEDNLKAHPQQRCGNDPQTRVGNGSTQTPKYEWNSSFLKNKDNKNLSVGRSASDARQLATKSGSRVCGPSNDHGSSVLRKMALRSWCASCVQHTSRWVLDRDAGWTTGLEHFAKTRYYFTRRSCSSVTQWELCHNRDITDGLALLETEAATEDALKVLYFILCHNLPLDLFADVVELSVDLGASQLRSLHAGKNATHTRAKRVHGLLRSLSEEVSTTITDSIQQSPTYSVMADEVMDVASRKHLAMLRRYVNPDGSTDTVPLNDSL